MRALIPELRKKVILVLLLATAATLVSCATKEKPRLVDDPDEGRESTIPWDKQEKRKKRAPLAHNEGQERAQPRA